MMSDKKRYEEDDGHTIVDMSDVAGGPLRGSWLPPGGHMHKKKENRQPEPEREERPWEKSDLTASEKWMYTLGALKAALLIGLAYVVGLGLLVGGLLLIWHIL